jgi:hypothetical protein
MKFLSKLFDLRGLKIWFLVLVFIASFGLTALFFAGINYWLNQQAGLADSLDLILMLGEFLVCGLLGFGAASLAHDHRGPSYAVWGGIASFIMVIFFMYQSGLLALLVGLTGLLGAYNGGMLGEREKMNRVG